MKTRQTRCNGARGSERFKLKMAWHYAAKLSSSGESYNPTYYPYILITITFHQVARNEEPLGVTRIYVQVDNVTGKACKGRQKSNRDLKKGLHGEDCHLMNRYHLLVVSIALYSIGSWKALAELCWQEARPNF